MYQSKYRQIDLNNIGINSTLPTNMLMLLAHSLYLQINVHNKR